MTMAELYVRERFRPFEASFPPHPPGYPDRSWMKVSPHPPGSSKPSPHCKRPRKPGSARRKRDSRWDSSQQEISEPSRWFPYSPVRIHKFLPQHRLQIIKKGTAPATISKFNHRRRRYLTYSLFSIHFTSPAAPPEHGTGSLHPRIPAGCQQARRRQAG